MKAKNHSLVAINIANTKVYTFQVWHDSKHLFNVSVKTFESDANLKALHKASELSNFNPLDITLIET